MSLTNEVRSFFQRYGPRIIDGGYLSYCFAPFDNFGNWFVTSQQSEWKNSLIFLDTPTGDGVRRELYPGYKMRREQRREDPEKARIRQRVMAMRGLMREHTSIPALELQGHEADDLIGVHHLLMGNLAEYTYIAIDKDFHQIPGLLPLLRNKDLDEPRGVMKLPKYALEPFDQVSELPVWYSLLCQCLFGDKSDSIPRLLPSHPTHARDLLYAILTDVFDREESKWARQAFLNAHRTFGVSLANNLRLLLIPSPTLFHRDYRRDAVLLETVTTNGYWNIDHNPISDLILSQIMSGAQQYLEREW